MADFFAFCFVSAIAYFMSLLGIEYANGKTQKVKRSLICLIALAFIIWNGWSLSTNQNKVPLEVIEKEWELYTSHCREEHISWNDLTFPEWLLLEASE